MRPERRRKLTRCAAIGNQKTASVGEVEFRSRTYGTIRSLIAILHQFARVTQPARAPSMIRWATIWFTGSSRSLM